MPAQKATTGLAGKLGNKMRQSHEAHKGDEIKLGAGARLPGGIDGGVAQLTGAKVDIYKSGLNQGEYYVQLKAVALAPETFTNPKTKATVKIAGTPLQPAMFPMCDTKKTDGTEVDFDQHYADMLNALKKLGVDPDFDPQILESTILPALAEAAPYFSYSTDQSEPSVQYPKPKVWENWGQVCDFTPGEAGGVEDNTGDAPADEPTPPKKGAAKSAVTKTPPKKSMPTAKAAPPDETEQLRELGEKADNGDEKAQLALMGRAKIFNIDPEMPESWSALADEIIAAAAGYSESTPSDEGAEASGEEEFVPAMKGIYFFKPKGVRKAIECEVTVINTEDRTVNLKNLDDKKTIYKDVDWDDLGEG